MRARLLALGLGLAVVLAIDQGVRLLLPPETKVEGLPWFPPWVEYHPILGGQNTPTLLTTTTALPFEPTRLETAIASRGTRRKRFPPSSRG